MLLNGLVDGWGSTRVKVLERGDLLMNGGPVRFIMGRDGVFPVLSKALRKNVFIF